MTDDGTKRARVALFDLAEASKRAADIMREGGLPVDSISVVTEVDRKLYAAFTDEDGPEKVYGTFVTRKLSFEDCPEVSVEITAFVEVEDSHDGG